jgi:O-methyltransferase
MIQIIIIIIVFIIISYLIYSSLTECIRAQAMITSKSFESIRNELFPFQITDMKIDSDNLNTSVFRQFTDDQINIRFLEQYKKFMDDNRTYSMAGPNEINQIYDLMKDIDKKNIPGDLIESGVWKGGMSIWMKAILNNSKHKQRKLYLFDTFSHFPNAHQGKDKEIDPVTQILFHNPPSIDDVKNNFKKFNLLDKNVIFVQGDLLKTVPRTPIDNIAILRLDADYYEPTMVVLENYYFKISKGGYVIIDDYNNEYLDCRTAVDDFRNKNGISNPILQSNGAVYWMI